MDKLKPCPFCGSEAAEPVFIGNDHTKKRTVTIKCKAPGCTKGVTVGALRFSHEWCHEEAVKKWNTRAEDAELTAAKARIAYFEQLAADRMEQMTADAEKIAELEKALEPFAREDIAPMYKDPWHLQFSDPDGFVDFTDFTIGDLRRAAALLNKEAL